jgi:hypothetical protein
MAVWHRCWRAVCLVLTAAFLVIGAYIPPRSNLTGDRHIDEGGDAPLVLPVSSAATGPLHVDTANPRYFTDGSGEAILLAGSHTWFTTQDAGDTDPPPAFDYDAFLNFVQGQGHNFFRTFKWEQSWKSEGSDFDGYDLPNIYARTGPGNALDSHPKFDLTQFNQDYFDRIRERVIQAGQ